MLGGGAAALGVDGSADVGAGGALDVNRVVPPSVDEEGTTAVSAKQMVS